MAQEEENKRLAAAALEVVLEDREDPSQMEESEPEIDSDEVPEDQIPEPRPERQIQVIDDDIEQILLDVQGKLQAET